LTIMAVPCYFFVIYFTFLFGFPVVFGYCRPRKHGQDRPSDNPSKMWGEQIIFAKGQEEL